MKHSIDKVRSPGLRFVGIRPTGTLLTCVEALAPDTPQ